VFDVIIFWVELGELVVVVIMGKLFIFVVGVDFKDVGNFSICE